MNRRFKDQMLSRVPPGYWMTQSKKATPPQFANVEDALQDIIDGLKVPENRNETKAYIYAGIPISTLTETIALTGYSENKFNPDVAELIKPALNVYLTDLATEDDFEGPFRLSPEPLYQEDIDEENLANTMMDLMEEENPALAKMYQVRQDEIQEETLKAREEEIMKRQNQMKQSATKDDQVSEGFITRKESV